MADAIKSVVLQVETILKGDAISKAVQGLENADGAAAELRKTLESVQTALNKVGQQRPLEKTNAEIEKTATGFGRVRQAASTALNDLQESGGRVSSALQSGFGQLTEVLSRNIAAFTGVSGGILGILSLPIVAFLKTTGDGIDLLNQGLEGTKAVTSGVVKGLAEIGEGLLKLDFSKIVDGLAKSFGSLSFQIFQAGVELEKFRQESEKESIVGEIQSKTLQARLQKNITFLSQERKGVQELKEAERELNEARQNARQLNILRTNQAERDLEQVERDLALKRIRVSEISTDIPELPRDQRDRVLADRRRRREEEIERNRQEAVRQIRAIDILDPSLTPEEQRTLLRARTALEDAKKQNEALDKQVQEQANKLLRDQQQLARQNEREKNEQLKQLQQLRDLLIEFKRLSEDFEIDDPLNVDKLANENDIIKAQRRIEDFSNKINQKLQQVFNFTDESGNKRAITLDKILDLKQEDLRELEKRFNLLPGSFFRLQVDSAFIQNQVFEAISRINQSRPKVEVEILPTVGGVTGGGVSQGNLPDISGQISKAVEATTPKKKTFFEIFFGDEKGKQAFGDAIKQIQTATNDLLNQFYESEIAKTDFLIQEQQRRIDETNRLAAFGNAEQLQLEQERLNNLLEERRKFEQAQQAINAAAAISATAASAANFTLALTKDAATLTPPVAIANSIALIATIAAGIAQISSLAQGFEKGTEYLRPGQKSNKGKTDTIPAWLAPGERVVPAMINEQLKGIKNADLPKLVAAGKMALEGYGQLNTSITSNSYGFTSEAVGILKRVEAGISEIPRALSDQIVDINFDHYGYVIQQRRVSRHAQKVKALTR